MSIMELGAIGEFIGAFGVIASLVYVGLQVRQNTRAMRSETRLGLANSMYQNHYDAALNVDMSRIIFTSATDPESMTNDDLYRWTFWFQGTYHMLEGYYHEYQEGQLSKEFMERLDSWIAGQMQMEHFRAWWQSERTQNRYTESFLAYVDGLISNPPQTSWEWRDPAGVFGPPAT